MHPADPDAGPATADTEPGNGAAPGASAPDDGEPSYDGRSGLRLVLILVASFMVVLDFTIVNIALPSIQREFHVSTATVQWVVTGYAIAFSGLLILGGRMADIFGRRRLFVVGLVVFSLSSLAGGLARDPVLLVVSRVVQGAGAALIAPAALALITTSFPPGPRRTKAIGLYGTMASVGFVAGQTLGGVLTEWTSWRAVFLVNVPVGLAAAVLVPRLIAVPAADLALCRRGAAQGLPGGRAARPAGRLDVTGAVLITAAVALAVFSISQGGVLGWTSPLVLGAAVLAVGAAGSFVIAENRHPAPLVQPRLLLRPGLRGGASAAFLLGVFNSGGLLVLSFYMQQVLHFSPLETGLIIAPQGIAGLATGMMAPRLAGLLGVRRVMLIAGTSATIGYAALTQLPAAGYSPLLLVVILVGFGGAGTAFSSIVMASRSLGDRDQGLAGGVVNTTRQMGAAVGAALLPAVAGAVPGVSGDRAAMLTATLVAVAVVALGIPWGRPRTGSLTGQA